MDIKLIHKKEYGKDRFYPHCEKSIQLLKVFHQTCLSKKQAIELKEIGFIIHLMEII